MAVDIMSPVRQYDRFRKEIDYDNIIILIFSRFAAMDGGPSHTPRNYENTRMDDEL